MKRRFVQVSALRLTERLNQVAKATIAAGGSSRWAQEGNELVFELDPRGSAARIRCFTTLPTEAAKVRGCGKDAVRIVVGVVQGDRFRPVTKAQRILRTAPNDVSDREGVFLERLVAELRGAFRVARELPRCPNCGNAMKRREGRSGAFMGCMSFPECKTTKPIKGAA